MTNWGQDEILLWKRASEEWMPSPAPNTYHWGLLSVSVPRIPHLYPPGKELKINFEETGLSHRTKLQALTHGSCLSFTFQYSTQPRQWLLPPNSLTWARHSHSLSCWHWGHINLGYGRMFCVLQGAYQQLGLSTRRQWVTLPSPYTPISHDSPECHRVVWGKSQVWADSHWVSDIQGVPVT